MVENCLPFLSYHFSWVRYRFCTNTALGLQFSASRGRCSPRSRIRIDLPDAASRWASVPPPAPEPMITTSKCDKRQLPCAAPWLPCVRASASQSKRSIPRRRPLTRCVYNSEHPHDVVVDLVDQSI